jgi:predicted AlkP superfamily pyrophosphatase or phosphodiesterase
LTPFLEMDVGKLTRNVKRWMTCAGLVAVMAASGYGQTARTKQAETPARKGQSGSKPARPKLVVMIVVDQMRADYIDKFRGQWNGGLKRLVDEGAWFRAAAYPYASTETCVGHATISTGAFPASHGMVNNVWWDPAAKKSVACTDDPNAKNIGYAGGAVKGGDSAASMLLPAYAEELKFQSGGGTRTVTFSLKARAAITLAGHKADAATWYESSSGTWETSSVYGTMPFVEEYAQKHPVTEDYGKTWSLSLPQSGYLYSEKAVGAATIPGWTAGFPHALRGAEGASAPDAAFLAEWTTSPFADTALTRLAEDAVDSLGLGKSGGTDYLGVSYSSTDYVGHAFGPRSWEIQDILVKLDRDLGEFFAHLDAKVGRGNYVVALCADHGVSPIPEDMKAATGFDAGRLNVKDMQDRLEKAIGDFHLASPAVAKVFGIDIYFADGVYEKLKANPAAMKAALDAVMSTPGVAAVFRADELAERKTSLSQVANATDLSFYPPRNGDLLVIQKPYWLFSAAEYGTGTSHGTPYYYDQRVPLIFMGFGIRAGEYWDAATPADIAPTFAALTGITLATRDGKVLSSALATK